MKLYTKYIPDHQLYVRPDSFLQVVDNFISREEEVQGPRHQVVEDEVIILPALGHGEQGGATQTLSHFLVAAADSFSPSITQPEKLVYMEPRVWRSPPSPTHLDPAPPSVVFLWLQRWHGFEAAQPLISPRIGSSKAKSTVIMKGI